MDDSAADRPAGRTLLDPLTLCERRTRVQAVQQ